MEEIYHATIFVGNDDSSEVFNHILKSQLDFETEGNPDFLLINEESFGIENARFLEKWALNKPIAGNKKVSLLITGSITFEAQNALLKVLEEPKENTYMLIGLKTLANILPTLLSRVRVVRLQKNELEVKLVAKFLDSDINQRLKIVKNILKLNDKKKVKNFITNLEFLAYKKNLPSSSLKNVLKAKIVETARGSSQKMIMEWLATVL